MATMISHPKKSKKCAFCKRWDGDANLKFKASTTGFEYTLGVRGKCMLKNNIQISSNSCSKFEPSAKVEGLM
jgi:hypothetical protein